MRDYKGIDYNVFIKACNERYGIYPIPHSSIPDGKFVLRLDEYEGTATLDLDKIQNIMMVSTYYRSIIIEHNWDLHHISVARNGVKT